MTPTRRILSVWLPHWPVTRLRRSAQPSGAAQSPVDAQAWAASASRGSWLVPAKPAGGVRRRGVVDTKGEPAGLRPSQTLTDARPLCPSLIVAEADPAAD